LFGHKKGAFTGAHQQQMGRFEIANGGTLFLDEIGELPLELQSKLLRVLQDGEFERLGDPKTCKVDVRIIAATNRDLEKEIQEGRFRSDLWYRLNVFPIIIPPLRERKKDIPKLVHWFVNKHARKMGKRITKISEETLTSLSNRYWAGNIRELENTIQRALIISSHDRLELFVKHVSNSRDREKRRYALDLLAQRMGERALPSIKREIDRNYYNCRIYAIHALMDIPGKESTELLLSLYKCENNRDAVKYALAYGDYREEARKIYYDILNSPGRNNNYFWGAVDASLEFGWKEAIPILERLKENPYDAECYVKCCEALRSFNDNSVPKELIEAEETIKNANSNWNGRQITQADAEHAEECIRNHYDIEGVMLISLSLATAWGKWSYSNPNEAGVRLLCELPKGIVLPVLKHLALNVSETRSRDRVVEVLVEVSSCEPTSPDISPT